MGRRLVVHFDSCGHFKRVVRRHPRPGIAPNRAHHYVCKFIKRTGLQRERAVFSSVHFIIVPHHQRTGLQPVLRLQPVHSETDPVGPIGRHFNFDFSLSLCGSGQNDESCKYDQHATSNGCHFVTSHVTEIAVTYRTACLVSTRVSTYVWLMNIPHSLPSSRTLCSHTIQY